MALFGGLQSSLAPKPVPPGALSNSIFSNSFNFGALKHLGALEIAFTGVDWAAELGNGGSVRLRAAAPRPFPALPLSGGRRGSIRWWSRRTAGA